MGAVKEAMLARRSSSKVTDAAPTPAEIAGFVQAAGQLADHSGLRPWRVIEIRGEARDVLGDSLAKADGVKKKHAEKYRAKAHRAPLVLAIVASIRPSHKVPAWEQEAVASGVAHGLSLVLDDEGWGVFWRTGELTRAKAVRAAHKLEKNEELLGWLYVGGVHAKYQNARGKKPVDPTDYLSSL